MLRTDEHAVTVGREHRLLHAPRVLRVALVGVMFAACAEAPSPPPHVTVWAWEAKQDLRFLPPGVDVALLAADLVVREDRLEVRKRAQPAFLPDGVKPLAVVHLETHGRGLDDARITELVEVMLERVTTFDARGLQLDFDARVSERDDAKRLLTALRARLAGKTLSMTGLASWCSGDAPWVRELPVDEVVPQLFQLGPEADTWRRRFHDGALAKCGTSVGLSTSEALAPVPGARHLYLFHSGPWTEAVFTRALEATR